MKILLTNDDGIHAMGLCALYEAFRSLGHEVTVVAPDSERSAVGHAITLSDPIKIKRILRAGDEFGWAINGTPADCVKLAVNALLKERPDLVVSGINRGANTGINLLYSGTVSAATEAAILGIRSIAVSIDSFADFDYCFAAFLTTKIAKTFMESETECHSLNVNVPSRPANLIKGIKVTKQCLQPFKERFEKRKDPRGNTYFWQCSSDIDWQKTKETDIFWLKEGYVTITPIKFDLTHTKCMEKIESIFSEISL